jgi:hypothetical protein
VLFFYAVLLRGASRPISTGSFRLSAVGRPFGRFVPVAPAERIFRTMQDIFLKFTLSLTR